MPTKGASTLRPMPTGEMKASEARKHFSLIFDQVYHDDKPVIVEKYGKRIAVVPYHLVEYLQEISRQNMDALIAASKKQHEEGQSINLETFLANIPPEDGADGEDDASSAVQ